APMMQSETPFFTSDIYWVLGIFALFFILLRFFVLPRLEKALREKSRIIDEEIGEVRGQREATQRMREQARKELDTASEEARKLLEASDERIRDQQEQRMDEFKADMQRREEAFHQETEKARQRAIREIRAEAAGMVSDATEKITHEQLDAGETDKRLKGSVEGLESDSDKPRKH
ncbi:MAG: ATP synthase F0 subunit B, partial [Mariprofundaceae bacterium]|nr:ATP synthase F0 subunit B [Mariprofundaceae bacterium]